MLHVSAATRHLVEHIVRSCRALHERGAGDDGAQPDVSSAAPAPVLVITSRHVSRHVVVDAIFGLRFGYDPTVRNLAELPQDVLLRIFSTLPAQSLCSLAQVSKSFNTLADDGTLWRAICGCGLSRAAGAPGAHGAAADACCSDCKEHVRDDHVQRLQCEALLWLMQLEERRRRHQARLRKLKQLFLPLLQTAFVLLVLLWPWETAPSGPGAAKPAKQPPCVQYQYATWDGRHALSPTVRAAAE